LWFSACMSNAKDLILAAGGPAAVARHFETTPQAVYKWARSNRIPADRVLTLIALAGGGYDPAHFCPEVFAMPANLASRATA
jgi:hypothetical protein